MKQESKQLVLKDLCARLPYGVFVNINGIKCILQPHDISDFIKYDIDIKLYLFPLSSMTEEQKKELNNIQGMLTIDFELKEYKMVHLFQSQNVIDWFNKNYFDYRGLIPMGLANDATGLNIY